ncbi:TraB family protein [Hartmannibacter diazotrophicus]|uniref:TraB family protein n=1 Tax=Hartmannibacter diazotrophicus TaxID=1482074 RepID=A0A2C9D7Y6_9HYPH|nr:TraB/GumN family protein [Hartmannibacter diazotrophicus]SON56427.1 TraB family protein [Hartmannibacter diazotrophicus]
MHPRHPDLQHLCRIAAFILALPFIVVLWALPVQAAPAMWVARDDDSTVYLLGSMHVLKPGTDWMSDDIARAFADSSKLVIETDVRQMGMNLLMKFGMSLDNPLSKQLAADELSRVRAAADNVDVRFGFIDPMRPWLAAATLGMAAVNKAGYSEAAGVEARLLEMARRSGKPVSGLETPSDQLSIFADQGKAQEKRMLTAMLDVLDDPDDTAALADRLTEAWKAGRAENLSELVDLTFTGVDADLLDRLLKQRNQRWASQISRMMQGSGTIFIAVGAAHLVGPDSVQHFLALKGIETERLQHVPSNL